MKKYEFQHGDLYRGDCLKVLSTLEEQSIDLICSSPPYEAQREYAELKFNLKGQDWVDWMVEVFRASLRVCKGLVAFVVGHGCNGVRNWSAAPALLMADLKRAGIILRNPAIYKRVGISGSGSTDWLRADNEYIVCATNTDDALPWSDNTACGHKPKYPPGGERTHRRKDGTRVHKVTTTSGYNKGDLITRKVTRKVTEIVNPGTIIDCGAVGGGHLGVKMAHENEAPFPPKIPNFFIRSFCPPDGVVCDPFAGGGTTLAEAIKTGRRFIGIDKRKSQIELCKRRIKVAKGEIGFGLLG